MSRQINKNQINLSTILFSNSNMQNNRRNNKWIKKMMKKVMKKMIKKVMKISLNNLNITLFSSRNKGNNQSQNYKNSRHNMRWIVILNKFDIFLNFKINLCGHIISG